VSLPIILLLMLQLPVTAQIPATLDVDVRFEGQPVANATVIVNGVTHVTADRPISVSVAAGRIEIAVFAEGFAREMTAVTVQGGQTQRIVIDLQREPAFEERVTVSATRSDKRLEDQPMRVEVLHREEVEEKMLMTPGDIVMMLNEMGGMRVQATSASLGAASVRIQGMRGRYTRFFSDGLPLFGEVGGLGLLQIPPMDLGQVEVIKGVASSLYGAGAMGGVVNLVSRRPTTDRQREVLVNRSTRGGTDAVVWYATPARPGWALTLLGGGHWQEQVDVNDDSWADLPGYSRAVVRPRAFWDGGSGRTLFVTAGFTGEHRGGGGRPAGAEYREALDTQRVDVGLVGQTLLDQWIVVTGRFAITQQWHDHQFGEVRERDRHETTFGEVTARAPVGRHSLVAGLALERDAYDPSDLPAFAYRFIVPGVFAQDDIDVAPWFSVSASGRVDHHSEYGTFFSPRISTLFRVGRWTSRMSAGTGFFGPSPLTEETEATGLSRLTIPQPLRAERGRTMSLDASRTDGPLSYTLTVFASHVKHPIDVDQGDGLAIVNRSEPARNVGAELVATLRREPYALTATYTYVDARERQNGVTAQTALTPRHSAGIVGMWEREGTGRVGVEFYYTGVQRLENNPFRQTSRPYRIVGLLAERRIDRVRLFVNGENLTGVRQTTWDPLIRPARGIDGRWTVDAWAPLEGRTINAGVRLLF
jgi:outer membrane receptor for ferrienterochelin and colicins